MKYTITASFLAAICITTNSAKDLPSYIKKCKSRDPHLNDCLKENIEIIRPHLPMGVPEMKFPPIDPMHVPKLELQTGNGTSGTLKAVVTDIDIYGVKDYVTKDFGIDFQTYNILIHFTFANIYAKGRYQLIGKTALFEIDSHGTAHVNISDVDVYGEKSFTVEVRDGRPYCKLSPNDIHDVKIGKVNFYFENLFENNPQLTEQVNKALNENADDIVKEVKPMLDETFIYIFSKVMQDFGDEYSLDEMFDDYV